MTSTTPITANSRVALLAGATGLVGQAILKRLLADLRYRVVHLVGRRAPSMLHPKLAIHTTAMLTDWSSPAVDDVYIALGTTIKDAGSRSAFRAVDVAAVVALARAAKMAGASRLAVVSAMGAAPQSPVFYNRIKAEMESEVSQLGYETLVIARPSLLAGNRQPLQQTVRPAEVLSQTALKWLNPLMPANYRSIDAGDVAQAMVRALHLAGTGQHVLLSGAMQHRPAKA